MPRLLGRPLALGAVVLAALCLGTPASAGQAASGGSATSETQVIVRIHPRTGFVDGQTDAEAEECTDTNRAVRIERARTGRIVARTDTNRDSTYQFYGVRLRPGRYVVAAPESQTNDEDGPLTCLRAVSRVFGVTARP